MPKISASAAKVIGVNWPRWGGRRDARMVEASAGQGPVRPVGPVDVRAVCGAASAGDVRTVCGAAPAGGRRRLAARVKLCRRGQSHPRNSYINQKSTPAVLR